jgi:cellulose synthase/poly-beta-1,6-N-acetylglucosamine synthase-like glycosyltransferase
MTPCVSVVMPVYNVEAFVAEAVQSVLDQSFTDFELIIVDDGGTDKSVAICRSFDDPRIRIVHQANRGLAGARNTGISESRGRYIALLDSDDRWLPEKLSLHVIHLNNNPEIGVSYCPSRFIDEQGNAMRLQQSPRLRNIRSENIFCRNPVGNGSAPVLRRAALDTVAFRHPKDVDRTCWFDEDFRQSEDVEMWLRLSIMGGVHFAGIAPALTEYRVAASGLSAQVLRQYQSWMQMVEKLERYAPDFAALHTPRARAYQLRYLARRSVQMGDPSMAATMLREAMACSLRPLIEEPLKTLVTAFAILAARNVKPETFSRLAGSFSGGRLVA